MRKPPAASRTLVHSTPLDVRLARVEGLRPLPRGQGLFQGSGSIESPALLAAFPFDDLIGSWNVALPPGASIELSVQARTGGVWSAWYGLGRWDGAGGRSLGPQADALGMVDIDTLKLKRQASAFRYRVRLEGSGRRPPRLCRVAISYADSSRGFDPSPSPFRPGPWVRELKLRPRSQMEEGGRYKRDICSPTALAMALDFWGLRLKTSEAVRLVEDHATHVYGNWTLNVAAASLLGLRGEVSRLQGLGCLEAEIARGRPVVVSIGFVECGLTGAPLRKTRGHLLVVAGFTEGGDVIAYDPAAPDRGSVRRVYRRREFARAWLRSKLGLAYLLGPADAVI